MAPRQLSLFAPEPSMPTGFLHAEELIPPEQEQELVQAIAGLPFAAFAFHGHLGLRRTVSFGWHYDFAAEKLRRAEDIPPLLLPLRERAAGFAGLSAAALEQVLVTEYAPGAPIGWHRDKPVFGDVVGISLLAPCTLRFRRRAGSGWERHALRLAPRSAYLLRGPSRTEWEHSIPPLDALRYSVTFRTLRGGH